jgi:cell volume regulation protein A
VPGSLVGVDVATPFFRRPDVKDAEPFALLVLLLATAGLIAIVSGRLTEWVRIPSPALVFAGSAAMVAVFRDLEPTSEFTVDRVVTIALLCILFDGGMHIGWSRFRAAATPIAVTGVFGTLLTVAAGAALIHYIFGLSWYVAVLLGTAVAPTDPAVVFSVLGKREVSGASGAILEGESGMNDPVGIALMASLIAAGSLSPHTFGSVGAGFFLQMGVGLVVGLLGGWGLLWFMREVSLPSEGLYSLRTLAGAFALYGVATVARGSGFLAVFVAGIVLGDARAPFKKEIERFHGALASLGEIAAFLALGLTADLSIIVHSDVWIPGLVLGAALAFVIRPVLVGLCLLPSRLPRNQLAFVLFAGLKGAVPILLGSFLLAEHSAEGERLYGIVIVVVMFSVIVQGSLAPVVARWLKVPMRVIEPQPWGLGVRLTQEPDYAHRFTVVAGSVADGSTIQDLTEVSGEVSVSLVIRAGRLVPALPSMTLRSGDDVMVLADPATRSELATVFGLTEVSVRETNKVVAWGSKKFRWRPRQDSNLRPTD